MSKSFRCSQNYVPPEIGAPDQAAGLAWKGGGRA